MSAFQSFLPTVRFRGTLAVSPDGRQVAYIDDALGQFNAVVQPVSGGDPQRLTSYVDSTVISLAWYPDGRSLLLLADSKGNENTQLYRVDISGGEPQALTNSLDVQYDDGFGYPFSPDGGKLAFAGNDRSANDQDVLVWDLATDEVQRIYAPGGRVFPGHWSPDGEQLTAIELRAGRSDHVVYLLSVSGGLVRRLTPAGSQAACWLGPWLPDGSGFLVMSDAGRNFIGLGVMDAETGDISWLDTPDWDVEEVALSSDGRTLLWSVNVNGVSQLRARDRVTGESLPVPTLPAGEISGLAVTPDGRTSVVLLSTPVRPSNLMTVDLTDREIQRLTDSVPVAADPATFPEPTLVHYPAEDGRQIPAYVYRPASSEPLGVVMAIHGGPALQERAAYSNDGFFQYLVSHGVAVFAPNIRGSRGYGMDYQRLSYRDWGGGDLADLANAARYLRRQGWVDPARIGLVGRSYGGFAVLSCVSRLAEFGWAAAVVWCGPSNLVTFTRSQPPTWRSHVAIMVGDPETDEEFLISRSPVTHADHIRSPLMIIQGANDPRVPKHESEQIVERLRACGVEVRYDVFPDEGHWFGKRENEIRARTTAGEFLLAHLTSQ